MNSLKIFSLIKTEEKNKVDSTVVKYSPTIKSENQLPAERSDENTV